MKTPIISACCLMGLAAAISFAADAPDRPQREGRPPGPRFVMPLMQALDVNSDGTLDEKEISNATAALKKLDKNADGKLTAEELRPARPEGGRRPPGTEGAERPNRPPPPPKQ